MPPRKAATTTRSPIACAGGDGTETRARAPQVSGAEGRGPCTGTGTAHRGARSRRTAAAAWRRSPRRSARGRRARSPRRTAAQTLRRHLRCVLGGGRACSAAPSTRIVTCTDKQARVQGGRLGTSQRAESMQIRAHMKIVERSRAEVDLQGAIHLGKIRRHLHGNARTAIACTQGRARVHRTVLAPHTALARAVGRVLCIPCGGSAGVSGIKACERMRHKATGERTISGSSIATRIERKSTLRPCFACAVEGPRIGSEASHEEAGAGAARPTGGP
jgi:hypothetical protein